jgi:hypothetical protein
MRLEEHVACMEDKKYVYNILLGNPDGKRPLGKSRRRWDT